MAGHSKWANTKHRKARVDAQRGKIFTKLAREISVAAREGGDDPETNFRLRLAVQRARDNNMPNDNINRAIQKGAGGQEGTNFEQTNYEGYATGGVAVLLDAMTDNKNRTVAEIRHIFSRHGGSLGESGCVSWTFNRKGLVTVDKESTELDEDDFMMLALEAGAEDVNTDEEGKYGVIASIDEFEEVRKNLQDEGVVIESFDVTMVPVNTIDISDPDAASKILKLMEALDDHDDVQNVYANFDMPEELMEQ